MSYKKYIFSLILFSICITTYAQPSFLDSTFGNNGIVITPPPGAVTYDGGSFIAVALQPDHKLVAAGIAEEHLIVVRYNENGSFDSTFSADGIFMNSPIHSGAEALVIQPDNKITIGGGGITIRLNSDGSLDNAFGTIGIDSTINFWAEFGSYAIALQSDGKIIIAGTIFNTTLGIGRLMSNGTPDSSFGTYGLVNTGFWNPPAYGSLSAVAVTPDGRIVAVGSTSTGLAIAIRMRSDGSPDTSFNHTGVVTTTGGQNYGSGSALQMQTDGKIIIAGATFGAHPGGDFALVRYDTDGTLDRSFGDTGIVNITFNGSDAEATALCITNDGQIIVTGDANSLFGLVRLDSNGIIDSSFGINGEITTTIQNGDDIPKGIAIQFDKKIVVAGWSYNNVMHGTDPTLARYIAAPPAIVKQQMDILENLVLYPNPSTGIVNINKSIVPHITNVTVADVAGKKVELSYRTHNNEIILNNVADGIYLFMICFNDRPSFVQKILIENNK